MSKPAVVAPTAAWILASGDHPVSKGRIVHVKKALAVAQPQGALVCFAAGEGKLGRLRQYESLIIDAGSRTFDWLVTRGMRLVTTRSNSVNRGVHNVLTMIAVNVKLKRPVNERPAGCRLPGAPEVRSSGTNHGKATRRVARTGAEAGQCRLAARPGGHTCFAMTASCA